MYTHQKRMAQQREYAIYNSSTGHWTMDLPHWFTQSEYEWKNITVESFTYFKPDGTLDLGTTFHSNTLSDGQFAQFDHMICLANDGVERTFFVDAKDTQIEFWFKDYLSEETLPELETFSVQKKDENKNPLYWEEIKVPAYTEIPSRQTTVKTEYNKDHPVVSATGYLVYDEDENKIVDPTEEGGYLPENRSAVFFQNMDENNNLKYYDIPDDIVYTTTTNTDLSNYFIFSPIKDAYGEPIYIGKKDSNKKYPFCSADDPYAKQLFKVKNGELGKDMLWVYKGAKATDKTTTVNIENIEYENIRSNVEHLKMYNNTQEVYLQIDIDGETDVYKLGTSVSKTPIYYAPHEYFYEIPKNVKYIKTTVETEYPCYTQLIDPSGDKYWLYYEEDDNHDDDNNDELWLLTKQETPFPAYVHETDEYGNRLYYQFFKTTTENTGDPVVVEEQYKTCFVIVCKLRF